MRAIRPMLRSVILGVLAKGFETKGLAVTDTIFDDSNIEQMESLPPDAWHRNVDLTLLQADKEGELPLLAHH